MKMFMKSCNIKLYCINNYTTLKYTEELLKVFLSSSQFKICESNLMYTKYIRNLMLDVVTPIKYGPPYLYKMPNRNHNIITDPTPNCNPNNTHKQSINCLYIDFQYG